MERIEEQYPAEEVGSIKMDIGCVELTVCSAEDISQIQIEVEKLPAVDYYSRLSGGTLFLCCEQDGISHFGSGNVPHMKVVLPRDQVLEEYHLEVGAGSADLGNASIRCGQMHIETGAGQVRIGDLQASRRLEIEIGAGSVTLENVETNAVDVECGVGQFVMHGAVRRDVNVECGVGKCDISLRGSEADYNYDVSCAIGSVSVNGMKMSGMAGKHVTNSAAATGRIHVSCALGRVKLNIG